MVFLAILYALRPDVVDLSKARTRSNRQNLEEAFRLAERELRIPRLLEPDGESSTLSRSVCCARLRSLKEQFTQKRSHPRLLIMGGVG